MLGLGQVEGAAVAGREGLPRLRGGGRRRRLRAARVGAAAPRALLREGKAEASAAAGARLPRPCAGRCGPAGRSSPPAARSPLADLEPGRHPAPAGLRESVIC